MTDDPAVQINQPLANQQYPIDPSDDHDLTVDIDNNTPLPLAIEIRLFEGGTLGNATANDTFPALSSEQKLEFIGSEAPSPAGNNRWFTASNASFSTAFAFGVYSHDIGHPLAHCIFFGTHTAIPSALRLELETPIVSRSRTTTEQLKGPVLLLHSVDPDFPWCWFSRPIDLSPDSSNPAFWMLQWNPPDTWSLYLRRVSGDLATYDLRTLARNGKFPIKLRLLGRGSRDIKKWPKSITLSPA